jgi:hypothetical protein
MIFPMSNWVCRCFLCTGILILGEYIRDGGTELIALDSHCSLRSMVM